MGKRLGIRSRARDATTRLPGYLALLREVCRARDRYRHYVQARRFANRGGIVVCDRFPIPQIKSMDAARIEGMIGGHRVGWLREWLLRLERSFYGAIRPPEVLLLLKLDPDIAVRRKTDEEASYVRARSREIWLLDDSQLDAQIVDASRNKDEVLLDIRQRIWSSI